MVEGIEDEEKEKIEKERHEYLKTKYPKYKALADEVDSLNQQMNSLKQ